MGGRRFRCFNNNKRCDLLRLQTKESETTEARSDRSSSGRTGGGCSHAAGSSVPHTGHVTVDLLFISSI